jgi:hypothetical protein
MKLCLSIATIGLTVASYAATTYYVAPTATGNGSSAGAPTNLTTAFLNSIARGHSDTNTVILLDGVYSGGAGIDSGSNVTLIANNRWGAAVAGGSGTCLYANGNASYLSSNITFDGIVVSNSTASDGMELGHHCVVRNCWIYFNYYNGINSSGHSSSNNLIEYNLLEKNGQDNTIYSHGAYVAGPNNVLRYNVARNDRAGYGLHIYTSGAGANRMDNNQLYNNLVYGNGSYGVALWGANGDDGSLPGTNIVYGNTILDSMQMAYGGLRATNNIFMPGPNSGGNGMQLQGGHSLTLTVCDYNLSTNALLYSGSHDVITSYNSIAFVNTNSALYWLASGSTARGVALTSVFAPTNFFGQAQASIADIGFVQYDSQFVSDFRDLSGVGANFWLYPPPGGGDGGGGSGPNTATTFIYTTQFRIGP